MEKPDYLIHIEKVIDEYIKSYNKKIRKKKLEKIFKNAKNKNI